MPTDPEDDAPDESPAHRRLGGEPPRDAPDMVAPQPHPDPVPDPVPESEPLAASTRPNRRVHLAVAAVVVALLGATAVAVFLNGDRGGFTPVGTDLTAGADPFEPAAGHHPFTAEQDMWAPLPQGRDWSHQDVGDNGATFHKTAADDTVILICGDLADRPQHHPSDFTDHEEWFAAERARDREFARAGDRYEPVDDPAYTDYVIDGRQAFLVEIRYHWTQWDDPEAGPTEVDYTRAHAYLYVDRGDLPAARCGLTAHHDRSDGYDEAMAALLGVRAQGASAGD